MNLEGRRHKAPVKAGAFDCSSPAEGPPLVGSRVLFLHSSDEAFGSDRILVSAIDTAIALGATVAVVLPDDTSGGWLSGLLSERGVVVRKIAMAPARRRYLCLRALPGYALMVFRARHELELEMVRFRPVIVHVNTSALLVAAIVDRRGARLVWHVHEIVSSPRPLAWLLRTVPMRCADDVIAVSEAVARNLRRAPFRRARLHRIYNAAPQERPRQDDRAPRIPSRVCTFAGRISYRKGYDLFLEAAREVAAACNDARFLIAGIPAPGEEWRMSDLSRCVQELGLQGRVEVLGMCEDLLPVFLRSGVVVVPSRLPEGFGLVAVEALSAGCAVILADHGAAREIVTHGETGLLVPPDDHIALAKAMTTLLRDDPLRQRLARQGRQHVTEVFSEQAFKSGLRAVWRADP